MAKLDYRLISFHTYETRKKLGADENSPIDIEDLVLSNTDFTLIYKPMSENISGLCIKEGNNKIIAINSNSSKGRQRFTLAHELFHYLQHQVLNFDFVEVKERKTYEDPEWQANTFAGLLLVPDEYLDNDNEYLVEHFQVSVECVLTRKVKHKKRELKEKGVIKYD